MFKPSPTLLLRLATVSCAALTLAGCGMTPSTGGVGSGGSALLHRVTGGVHGGQQPVAGATIALYAAGTTGIASAARSMLTAPVTTDTQGNFSITGLYSCNPGDEVYLVATGGDAGAGVNPAIALMAALGPCATLLANAATTYVNVTEVTTVASVFSLAPYMTGYANVGADAAHADALAAAMANTQAMTDLSTGYALQTSLGNGIVPLTTINSLANSIANCINSSPGSTGCSSLFSAAAVGAASTPSDTIGATLDVALNPAANPSGVYLQASATPPFQPTLTAAPTSYALKVLHPSDVLMYHNNPQRTGVQAYETTLTQANVNDNQFKKLVTYTVDSYLFAQPLYVGGIGMRDGVLHDVVYVAMTHGTVYAFDADGNSSTPIWTVNYIPSGERYAQQSDYSNCSNPPEAGIVGTPVIDRDAQLLYFVTKSVTSTGTATFHHRLHAVSLIDGSEQAGSPQIISPTFNGTGAGTAGGTISFNGQTQNQRSALLLTTSASGAKTVWIDYASHCDIGPYHGIVLGYNTANLATPSAAYIDTPNDEDGGIWGSNGGLAADASGYVYALVGNGGFDANTGGSDYGDSALKLAPPAANAGTNLMAVKDYFTPSNQATLSQRDLDLGGAEPILFTDAASGVAPNLMIASDKNGYIYLLSTDNLGHYDAGSNGIDGENADLQDFGGSDAFIWNFSFFNNTLYTGVPLRAYAFTPGTSTTAGSFNTTPVAQQADQGVAPVVSANGSANGIVWVEEQDAQVQAFTAGTLTLLYDSGTGAANARGDAPPPLVKFTSPVIANGKVYVSGNGALAIYGLF